MEIGMKYRRESCEKIQLQEKVGYRSVVSEHGIIFTAVGSQRADFQQLSQALMRF